MRRSNIVKQKTLDKLYLYKNGDECDRVTGGWIYGASANAGTGSKNEDNLYLKSPVETSRYTTYIYRTNNKINMSKFNSVHVIMTTKDINGSGINIVGMFNDEYAYYGSWVCGVTSNNQITQLEECTMQEFVKELDKTNVDEYGFAGTVAGRGTIGEKTTMLVYEIWLE